MDDLAFKAVAKLYLEESGWEGANVSVSYFGGTEDRGGNGEVRRPGRPDPGAERGDAGELTGADGGVRPGDRHRGLMA